MKVTVCIASIGRKSLLATLDSLYACNLPLDVTVNVVIADDSSAGLVQLLLDSYLAKWSFDVKVAPSAASNIATARNVCLENADGDYLAFVDDDETVDKDWLYHYVMLAISSDADALFGPVDAIYPKDATQWVCDAKPFVKRVGQSGDKVKTGSTCNAFVKRSKVHELNLSFRPDLGRSGGEDTAFFSELTNCGGKLIACEGAMVYEQVPLERLNTAHLSRRYIRGGQTYANLFISPKNVISQALAYIASAFKVIVLSVFVPLCFFVRRDVALKYAFRLWLNLGKLRNLINMPIIRLY